MKKFFLVAGIMLSVTLSACTSTSWNHTQLSGATAERQFMIDDSYCTQVSHGIAVPQVPQTNSLGSTTYIQGQTRTHSAGHTSSGSFSGTATSTPNPSAAFASGMADGMNIGMAIRARRDRDRVYQGCMYERGWTDQAVSNNLQTPADSSLPRLYQGQVYPISRIQAYTDPEEQWRDEVGEFLRIYPGYNARPELYRLLDTTIKEFAHADPSASGLEILESAHRMLVATTPELEEKIDPHPFLSLAYPDAVQGSAVDQAAIGLGYMQGIDPLPNDFRRALVWFKKSAQKGNLTAKTWLGLLLFHGQGVDTDRVAGYTFVAEAASRGDEIATELLTQLEEQLSQSEISSIQSGNFP